MPDSCIIPHFKAYAELAPFEAELLKTLELNPRAYSAGAVVRARGEHATCFFTLSSGWAYACRDLADGDRQVLDIFLPGQIMGLREVGHGCSQSNFVALTDIQVCPFPKARITELFDESTRLADLFMLTMAREQSILIERLVNLGRRPADQRFAHFLLEMKARIAPDASTFELPMSQGFIGDALGLSSVHISRTLKSLNERDLVAMHGNQVRINDCRALSEFANFDATYLDTDTTWVRRHNGDKRSA